MFVACLLCGVCLFEVCCLLWVVYGLLLVVVFSY